MTRRVDVSLEQQSAGNIRFIPQVVKQTELEQMSVKKWSQAAVERMFESAEEALASAE